MRVNRENITKLTIKKTKVATKAKPTETMREADSSPQAPGLPMPNMDEKVTKLEAQLKLVPTLVEQVLLLKAEVEAATLR